MYNKVHNNYFNTDKFVWIDISRSLNFHKYINIIDDKINIVLLNEFNNINGDELFLKNEIYFSNEIYAGSISTLNN